MPRSGGRGDAEPAVAGRDSRGGARGGQQTSEGITTVQAAAGRVHTPPQSSRGSRGGGSGVGYTDRTHTSTPRGRNNRGGAEVASSAQRIPDASALGLGQSRGRTASSHESPGRNARVQLDSRSNTPAASRQQSQPRSSPRGRPPSSSRQRAAAAAGNYGYGRYDHYFSHDDEDDEEYNDEADYDSDSSGEYEHKLDPLSIIRVILSASGQPMDLALENLRQRLLEDLPQRLLEDLPQRLLQPGAAERSTTCRTHLTEQEIARLPTSRYTSPKSSAVVSPKASESISPTTSQKTSSNSNPTNYERQTECAFCLDDFRDGDVVRSLPCFHFFHSDEIDDWLRRRATCPLCNTAVVFE